MSRIEIIGAPQSPFVWATRMAAAEKGLDVELVAAPPHAPEIYAIQPFGKIPALRHGDFELAESHAIARYLDTLNPDNPLFPREPVAAARADQWIMHLYTEYAPALLGRYIALYIFPANADGTPDRAAIDAGLPQVQKCLAILERQLDGRDFIAGPFTYADLPFAAILHYASALPEGGAMIEASPRVKAYLARMAGRPSFQATFPPPLPARAPPQPPAGASRQSAATAT